MPDLPFACACNHVSGRLREVTPNTINHVRCYCRSCQAFAHYLDRADDVLDARGGTEVVQMTTGRVAFDKGLDRLGCVQLTPKGPLRWYCRDCRTPIGNSSPAPALPFIGMIHTCIGEPQGPASKRDMLGPVRAEVFTRFARGDEKPAGHGLGRSILRFGRLVIVARLRGEHRRSPFLDPASGLPIVAPHRLSEEELAALYRKNRTSV